MIGAMRGVIDYGRQGGQASGRGSAPVEFVLVAPLVLMLFAAIVQIALAAHVRSTLIAAAAEGARAAANAGASDVAGQRRTRAAVATSIADGVVREIEVKRRHRNGLAVVEVTIHATLPLVGLLGPASLDISGSALQERL